MTSIPNTAVQTAAAADLNTIQFPALPAKTTAKGKPRESGGGICYRNLDATLNLTELFVQSHAGEIHLLPALPAAWPEGQVTGLKARGGDIVDVAWRGGRVLTAKIHAAFAGRCRVRRAAPRR